MLKSFLIKLQTSRFIEKGLQDWCFLLHVRTFLRTPILRNSERLVLITLLLLQLVFSCLFTILKKNDLSVKKMFIEIKCNQVTYVFKGHAKIVKIYIVKFN